VRKKIRVNGLRFLNRRSSLVAVRLANAILGKIEDPPEYRNNSVMHSSGTKIITVDPLIKYAIVVKHIAQKDYKGLWGSRDASCHMYRIVDAVDGKHYADLLDTFFRPATPADHFPILPHKQIIQFFAKTGQTWHCEDAATV